MRLSLFLATTALSIIATSASADETLKFRSVYHATSVQTQNVGDVEGHVLGLVRMLGLASFADGSVATDNFVATNDYVKGAGPFLVYGSLTFSDGSVLWYKNSGTGTVQGADTNFKGTVTILGGKGRFEGAKGDGSTTATRSQPLGAADAQLYGDATLNIKK